MSQHENWDLRSPEIWLGAAFWLACFAFAGAVLSISLNFPQISTSVLDGSKTAAILALPAVLAILLLAAFVIGRRSRARSGARSAWMAFLDGNLPGLLLAALFFCVYFSLAVSVLGALPDDNFYDTDSSSWLNRFAAPAGQLTDMRPVHPFAFLIFRPLTWLASPFTLGDRPQAALLLNAAAGALCVFLAWIFMKRVTGNRSFALVSAALLGATTSHLVLGSALETYIFSAAALIAFLVLATRERISLKSLAPAGLVIFGITITNFIQTLIVFAFREFNIPRLAKYSAIVVVAAGALAFLQASLYPTSQPFYVPSNLQAEDRFSSNPLTEGSARLAERASALGRSIAVFSVVAPRPLVLLKETGCEFPCFQTYKHRWNGAIMNSYAGLGSWLARTWFLVLFAALILFVRKWLRSPRDAWLPASLLACVLFNFVLHVVYGDDPMLYSADWTYAVVFFTLLAFKDWADRVWLRAGLVLFLALLMVNNWRFLAAVFGALSPYFS